MTTQRTAIDVGILVGDLEQSLRFYRDALGLSVVAEVRTSLIGTGRMVQIQHGASLLKLVELAARPPAQRNAALAAARGYRYITLLVDDIAAILAQVERASASIVLPRTQLDNGTEIAMIEDPDGNVVELVQEAEGS